MVVLVHYYEKEKTRDFCVAGFKLITIIQDKLRSLYLRSWCQPLSAELHDT